MKVYIATPAENRLSAIVVARMLRGQGHEVMSTWHDREPGDNEDGAHAVAQNFAAIEFSDALLFLDHCRAKDALVEVGFAWGRCRKVIGIGPRQGRSIAAEYCGAWFTSSAEALATIV